MAKQPRPIIWSNPAFKLLIWIVTGTMVLAFIGLTLLAFFGHEPPTQHQTRLAEVCYYAVTFTLPALVGLLCGRAGAPDPHSPAGR
jgi:hypothetical protein